MKRIRPQLRRNLFLPVSALGLLSFGHGAPLEPQTQEVHPPQAPAEPTPQERGVGPRVRFGERLDPALSIGPGVIETMDEVLERERRAPFGPPENHKARDGAQGWWAVASRRGSLHAHSGEHYAVN